MSLVNTPDSPFNQVTPAAKTEIRRAADTLAARFVATSDVETLFRLLSLPKVGLVRKISETRNRCGILVNGTMQQVLHLYSTRTRCSHHEAAQPAAPVDLDGYVPALTIAEVKRVQKHISEGYLRKAANVVRGQQCVASMTPEVEAKLRALHPAGPLNPCGAGAGTHVQPLQQATARAAMTTIIGCLSPQVSPGVSGWTTQWIQLCYNSDAHNKPFQSFLIKLAQQTRVGNAPGKVLLLLSRLTALEPEPGGPKIRPIANGEMLLKVCARFTLNTLQTGHEVLPCQLGVGTPGGVEPIVHRVQQHFLECDPANPVPSVYTHVHTLDVRNAFNEIDRSHMAAEVHEHAPAFDRTYKWMYNDPAPLVVKDGDRVFLIPSSQGVRQGCVMASFFFTVGIRDKMRRILLLHNPANQVHVTPTSYMDDIAVLSNQSELMPQLAAEFAPAVAGQRPADGLVLRMDKCKVTELQALHGGIAEVGMPLLGSLVGRQEARRSFLNDKIKLMKWRLSRIHNLPKQIAWRILSQCISKELMHLLRSMDTSDLPEEKARLDTLIVRAAERIREAPLIA